MTSPYKKRYPKGLTIPSHNLLYLLCRVYDRYDRWKHQAVRRQPTLLRPLTPGDEHERQEGWRREWNHATPERKQCISEVEKGHAISARLRAFTLLRLAAERSCSPCSWAGDYCCR
jgi:hypothetical protein